MKTPSRLIVDGLILVSIAGQAALLAFLVMAAPGRRPISTHKELIPIENERDANLVHAVERAVAKKIEPLEVETFVGSKVAVNTMKGNLALEFIDIVPENPEDDPPPVHSASNVVFWLRPIEGKARRVVGITWDDEGEPTIFSGFAIHR